MYNIMDYGAMGDGAANDAPAIQKAVDECSQAGGGVVLFPGGRVYRSGSVVLKSNVEIHLEPGAVWKAWDTIEEYYPLRNNGRITAHESGLPSFLNSEYAGRPFNAFIYALEEENITISGQGTIDGNESIFYGDNSGYHIEGTYYPRVPLLLLEAVNHLTIRDVRLVNCAFWTVHLVGCNDVLIDGIRLLNNLKMANSDGIDPDHCKNVRISNCHIECGDDAIVLKNSGDYKKYGACENIVITNCTLISTSAAYITCEGENGIFLLGSSDNYIEDVTFDHIRLVLDRKSKWEIEGYDKRPCQGDGEIRTMISGIYVDKARDITFQDVKIRKKEGILPYYREDVTLLDAERVKMEAEA